MAEKKKKCRQYSVDYLKFGMIPSPQNVQLPMCLLCEQTFSKHSVTSKKFFEVGGRLQSYILSRGRWAT